MASSGMLTEKLLLALNNAKDVVKSEDSQIVKKLMTSLNNKESFSDDSTMDEIRAAVEARQQERANEDEVILGIEPEETTEETTEEPEEETTEETTKETKEDEDIMSKFKWVLISIGIFVFLIILGSIFYWYFSSQPEETIMQPRSNIQPVSAAPPPQNVEAEPTQNYSYLPFMSTAAVPDVNKSNELEKQEQERKRLEQEAELKRIEEQQERLKQEEQQRIEEEQRLKQEEEKRMQEEQQRIEEEKRMQEEQQRIRDDKEEQEELIKQSLDDDKKLDDKNNSNYNMNSTAYTDTSSSSSESSDDENKKEKKGGRTKKQATQAKQVAKRKYVRKTK